MYRTMEIVGFIAGFGGLIAWLITEHSVLLLVTMLGFLTLILGIQLRLRARRALRRDTTAR
ncbi:hypothetical protein C3E77_14450 [Mycetocola zhujimingii]|nr:hypothetical protein C3E77_14450 [Mycetocola zhujimingii]